jgi:VanZ family protein
MKIVLYWKALIWAFFILIACGVNGSSIPKVSIDIELDKIAHFILFLVQAILIYIPQKKNLAWAILISVMYGVLLEFLQMTVFINRSFDYADMLADAIGAVMSYPLLMIWERYQIKRFHEG